MSVDRSFLSMGLEVAERALTDLVARDNLHLRPEKMPRTRRAKANGRLKQIEQIVRRLLTLMALSLHIVFAPPRKRAPAPGLPEGVELVTFPGAADPCFALPPRAGGPFPSGPVMDTFGTTYGPQGPVPTARLLARIRAIRRVLKSPDSAAKRLARFIQRLRARGEPRPMAGYAHSAFRLSPELGALSTALPGLLNASLEATWEESG
ncbi:hypothetical protein [Hyphomonas sp. UBA2660]|uniref:hypothetical protein n=1 Tax=Hyphomonas sp. UBA2660 TaxID=1946620 RepID=UPI0025B8D21C|nr:hypothetical protein [Hyphomonas sp. UBA2660]